MLNTRTSTDDYYGSDTTPSTRNPSATGESTFPAIEEILAEELNLCLIISDANECNQNLSTYIKTVVDIISLRSNESNYHQLSLYAMKLITSNLFIKNYQLCLGKILGLFKVFTNIQSYEIQTGEPCSSENDNVMKEFLCITMFLLLKLKNSEDDEAEDLDNFHHCMETEELFHTLQGYKFVTVIANFIVNHVKHANTSFILLKFCCDIIFEYLYHVELLSDFEFDNLVSQGTLISTLIKDLLQNNSFHDYDINESEWQNEEKLIAYEEFKLLLLLNEQYLMKSYTCPDKRNKIFDSLMGENAQESTESTNSRISGFMNLLVFHLNREESQIIKILILKFLYLIFTSSYTSKLYYLNDLKILVDIFVRELNNIEYMRESNAENRILVVTFLKVMYPMMMFSQLCDLDDAYKKDEIMYMLSHITSNVSSMKANKSEISSSSANQLNQISELAQRCMSVTWLKKKTKKELGLSQSNSSSSSLNSISRPSYDNRTSSTDSIANSFTRVASMRASNRSDYHLNTTKHNAGHDEALGDMALENNNNVFISDFNKLNMGSKGPSLQRRQSNILDLPHEYLDSKEPSMKPIKETKEPLMNPIKEASKEQSALMKKASRKKAPPPPSPKYRTPQSPFQRTTHSLSPAPSESPTFERSAFTPDPVSPSMNRTGPPPPPPRKRRS